MSVQVTFIGHSTVLLDVGGTRLLTDPFLRTSLLRVFTRVGHPPPPISPPPDALLISHQHPDHLDARSLRQLGSEVPVIAPRGAGKTASRIGMSSVRVLEPGERSTVNEVEVIATPAMHGGERHPLGRRGEAVGFELRGAGARVYFAGDTDLFDEMSELAGVDLALLPIGGIGPSLGEGHLDPERVVEAVRMLRPRVVVPIHWGTLLRSDLHRRRPELLTEPPRELERLLRGDAPAVELRVLQPGESTTVATGQEG